MLVLLWMMAMGAILVAVPIPEDQRAAVMAAMILVGLVMAAVESAATRIAHAIMALRETIIMTAIGTADNRLTSTKPDLRTTTEVE